MNFFYGRVRLQTTAATLCGARMPRIPESKIFSWRGSCKEKPRLAPWFSFYPRGSL